LLPRLHHHRQVVNFGISTTISDRLFGTFEPTNEPATLLLLEHDQIVLHKADLQAKRDEPRIERQLHPRAVFSGAHARERGGLEDLPDGYLRHGLGPVIDAAHGSRAEMPLPFGTV